MTQRIGNTRKISKFRLFLSILLIAAFSVILSVSAFAEDTPLTITIENPEKLKNAYILVTFKDLADNESEFATQIPINLDGKETVTAKGGLKANTVFSVAAEWMGSAAKNEIAENYKITGKDGGEIANVATSTPPELALLVGKIEKESGTAAGSAEDGTASTAENSGIAARVASGEASPDEVLQYWYDNTKDIKDAPKWEEFMKVMASYVDTKHYDDELDVSEEQYQSMTLYDKFTYAMLQIYPQIYLVQNPRDKKSDYLYSFLGAKKAGTGYGGRKLPHGDEFDTVMENIALWHWYSYKNYHMFTPIMPWTLDIYGKPARPAGTDPRPKDGKSGYSAQVEAEQKQKDDDELKAVQADVKAEMGEDEYNKTKKEFEDADKAEKTANEPQKKSFVQKYGGAIALIVGAGGVLLFMKFKNNKKNY
jgi:hypothetical protein